MIERCSRVGVEDIALSEATGRVLAAPARADRPSPAADLSAMDGFAVRVEDARSGLLPVMGEVRIGLPPKELKRGCAVRIVTGGAIPPGADAVVKIEDVQPEGDSVRISEQVLGELRIGANIRRRGENVDAGAEIVGAGRVITPAVAVALASVGVSRPVVYRRVRIAVISTGDEVVGVEDVPTVWQVRDGNGPGLRALIGSNPVFECVTTRRVGDNPDLLHDAIEHALGTADAVMLSGGVSMGHRDFVPDCLRTLGADEVFRKIPQRPGRPMLGAIGPRGQPVFGLPGNPLSVLVTGRRIAAPVLEHVGGMAASVPPLCAMLDALVQRTIPLWWHRLVSLVGAAGPSGADWGVVAVPVDVRSSGDTAAACRSDGFVEIPPDHSGAGPWPFYSWRW